MPAHTSLLSAERALPCLFRSLSLSLSLWSWYNVLFQGCFCERVCLWSCKMKYCSHKKWLSSLSPTTLYNEGPVQAETRGIVTQQHTQYGALRTLRVEEQHSVLTTTSHAGLLAFFSTLWILSFKYLRWCFPRHIKDTTSASRGWCGTLLLEQWYKLSLTTYGRGPYSVWHLCSQT